MKKNYLFGMLALAAMTMVGCSNDEVVNDYSQDNAIQFGTYVGRDAESRAYVIDTEVLGKEGFGVFAYYHKGENTPGQFSETSTPDFMYNEQVTNTGTWNDTDGFDNDWIYNPVKYWPNNVNDRVSFFAYAPWQGNAENSDYTLSANTATSYPTISYKVEVNDNIAVSENQKDLLYLKNPEKYMNMPKPGINSKIEFVFGHALSRIGFAAKVLVDEVNQDPTISENKNGHVLSKLAEKTKITINSVKLTGPFYKEGTLSLYRDNSTEAWSHTETPSTSFSWFLDMDDFVEGENIFENEDVYTGQLEVNNGKYIWKDGLLNKSDKYLMIMPQNFTDEELTVTVDYNVVTEDTGLEEGESNVHNIITSVPFKFEFKEGHSYVFILHLGMTSVKLSASVDGWTDGKNWSVNVPVNSDGTTNQSEWNKYYGIDTNN